MTDKQTVATTAALASLSLHRGIPVGSATFDPHHVSEEIRRGVHTTVNDFSTIAHIVNADKLLNDAVDLYPANRPAIAMTRSMVYSRAAAIHDEQGDYMQALSLNAHAYHVYVKHHAADDRFARMIRAAYNGRLNKIETMLQQKYQSCGLTQVEHLQWQEVQRIKQQQAAANVQQHVR